MSPTLDCLHIASFQGNIGDNANHNGTRNLLEQHTSYRFECTENEIRKYYQNYTKPDAHEFDESFVEQANNHDCVFIGSGNFFETWIDDSVTGTTIDMETTIVDKIEVPMVFYGLGFDPYKGISGNNLEKFTTFFDAVLDDPQCLVSVRNDGSTSHIETHLGESYLERVHKVPDGGFFTEVDDHDHPGLLGRDKTIAINVAKDMIEKRFPNDGTNMHTYDSFLNEFATFVDALLESNPELNIVFVPHIYSDLQAISEVLEQMENMHRRGRVTTAPYLNGEGSERHIFDIYNKVDLSIGMRFHANVCPFGLRTPSIGLVSYPKVGDLYDIELSLPERAVDITRQGFNSGLVELTETSLKNSNSISATYDTIVSDLRTQKRAFHEKIEMLLDEHYS